MSQRFLLLAIVLVAGALGGGLWWSLRGGTPAAEPGGLDVPEILSKPPAVDPGVRAEPLSGGAEARESGGDPQAPRTMVVIPLKLEFELLSARGRLTGEGVPPLGASATARLRGSVHRQDGSGVDGRVEFIAGPNAGRVLETDVTGAFGANDLYAGLSLVRIVGAGVPGAEREVLLRAKRESQLNIGFGRPAMVFGQVRDHRNEPLPFATVVMDGQAAETDADGVFRFLRMTSGKVPVYVSKPGFASHREMLFISAGSTIPPGKLKYVLQPAATLKVTVADRLGTGGPGKLFLSGPLEPRPLAGGKERKYPWHRKSPATIYAGETIEVEDLAAGPVRLQLFLPGALAEPKTRTVTLIAGETRHVTFRLKAAPILSGRVTQGGDPVERAVVRLEAPDVTAKVVDELGGQFGAATLEMEVLGQVPPAVQTVRTGADGRFLFSAAEHIAEKRYLTARSADGKSWGGRVVGPGELEVDLELKPAVGGLGSLVIDTSTRYQGLPVEYSIDGKPGAVTMIPGEPLRIPEVPEGDWRFTARWGRETIFEDTPISIDGQRELFIPLPQGAIDGQSKRMRDAMQR